VRISSRIATAADLEDLVGLYRDLEHEQAALRPLWPIADGLSEPVDQAFLDIMTDDESMLVIGELDDVPLGFGWCRAEDLLPQANGERVAVVRLIHTEFDARGVGIGEAMVSMLLEEYRSRGFRYFDARVSPGHRNAKNFFEANGFSARLIVMHHDDGTTSRAAGDAA
jgi:ribosomal protein S18 acetylase RimI-like enzyme